MSNLAKYLLIIVVLLGSGSVALAQDSTTATATATAEESANLDESVQASDLNIEEPTLLPDSRFYFLKNWAREIQSAFTFNAVKKAELRLKFANEKAIEMEKVIQKTQDTEIIKKAIENYQQEVIKVEKVTQKIKEKAEESEPVAKFLDKFIQQQTLQQKVLQKLQEQVPSEVYEKIEEARQQHLEKFGAVMYKLENKEKLQERLEKNLEKVKGSEFKNFKNLEVLLELKEKAPEAAKEAIEKAQENALKRLKGNLEQMSPEDQERFKEYLEKISTNKEKQMEVLENLKEELKENPELKEKIFQAREKIMEKIQERTEERQCITVEKPAPNFCKEGRIVVKKDEKGCIISFECVIPSEVEIPENVKESSVCVTLWDPVCGKDGKIYSNVCFAELAGVEVAYKGKCEAKECQTDADCPQLRCGPVGIRCIGVKSKCVEGKCVNVSVSPVQ